jgi:hypothetical protein
VYVTSTQLSLGAVALLLVPALACSPALAQQAPPPVPAAASALAPYQLPLISIAQPAPGIPLPADRPVVLVRFAAREPRDPIDPASFAITVDGKSRTAAFTVTEGEAWGLIRDADSWTEGETQAGTHVVAARICSTRGACAEVTATVEVKASTAAGNEKKPSTRERFLLLLLRAAQRIIEP